MRKQNIIHKISSLLIFIAILPGCDDVIEPMQDFKTNEYPDIISFASDLPEGTELTPNLAVTLSVDALDPEGEPLVFEYDSEDGSFSNQNDSDNRSTVVFHTASYLTSAQSVTVSVKVSDNKGFSVSRQLELGETRDGPTVTAIGTVPEYIKSTSQAEMTFSANQSGLYEVLVYDDTGATATWDDSGASYFYGAGDEVIISIDGPSWAGESGNAQMVNPPDRVAVVLKDSLESVATYSFILDIDDDAPVSSVDVAGTSSFSPIPVTISSTDAKSGVAAISYTLDGSVPDFSGNGTVVSGSSASITVGTDGVGSYTLRYRAKDNLGNLEDIKTETYIIQADAVEPGPVTDLIATQAGGGQISLSWTEPSDSDLDHILITWVPDGATGTTVPAGTTSRTQTGFTTGTTYTLTITAVDTSYNESTASTITITPPASYVPVHYVYSSEDLNAMRGGVAAGWELDNYYILMTDIDLSGYGEWTAIGDNGAPFKGTFDGNDHTISGLFIDQGSTVYQGLFGYTDGNAQLMNITIQDCTVTGQDYVGGLAGSNFGVISNCHIEGGSSIQGDNMVGGLAGYNNGSRIIDSSSNAVVYGQGNHAGGLIGQNVLGTIANSHATGNVTGEMNNNGGLIGYNYNGSVANSYATGSVTGVMTNNGGLIGYNNNGPVTGCHAEGIVTGSGNDNGGLIGYNNGSGASVTNSYATGHVIANANYVSNNGGLIGFNTGGTITGCYAVGNLTYNNSIVTLMGANHGGLIGRSTDANITGCYATGDVESYDENGDNDNNGGLIGSFEGSGFVLSRSYATGSVDTSLGGLCGGLVGVAGAGVIIDECYATGEVTGFSQIGGLVGLLDTGGKIENCYSVSPLANSVYGDSRIGGLVGYNNGDVSYSYAARDLAAAGGSYYGGLIGYTGGGTVNYCYYDAGLCGYSDYAGWTVAGTPAITTDMKIQATYTGWDFSTIWGISGLINDGYPYLRNNN